MTPSSESDYLRREVLRQIVRLGRADAADLAGRIILPKKIHPAEFSKELVGVLELMERERILKRTDDWRQFYAGQFGLNDEEKKQFVPYELGS